jgi:hypothetical protein
MDEFPLLSRCPLLGANFISIPARMPDDADVGKGLGRLEVLAVLTIVPMVFANRFQDPPSGGFTSVPLGL